MRNKANKHFGLQITPEMHGKLNYIAKYEGRSMNGQVLHLIRQCVRDYERQNGEIVVPPDDKSNEER